MTNLLPLAAHETLEIHEAINLKTLNLLKSKLLQGIVFDAELRGLLQTDAEQHARDLAELEAVYMRAAVGHAAKEDGG